MPRITITCTETGLSSADLDDLSALIELGSCVFCCDGSIITFDPDNEEQRTEILCQCGETFVIDEHGIVFYGEPQETLH